MEFNPDMKKTIFKLFSLAVLIISCRPAGPPSGATMTSPMDGATLVFVPAGEFLMGSDENDLDADEDEKPQHTVYLDAFWIDRTEVTNDMYRQCVTMKICSEPAHSPRYDMEEYGNHPILGVSWDQAVDYCAWTRRRLPTEAEWEKAARGTDGRLYPWGNEAPNKNLLNFDHQVDDTVEVGNYPAGASPYGVLDMAGNVWEWTSDGYDEGYYVDSPSENPQGGESVNQRVLKGGSWNTQAHNVRSANRFWAFPGRNDTDGFRCAMSADK
jgi:formylglycine-generating enzyme required for sulfatase activity